jgi:hypothetical protein
MSAASASASNASRSQTFKRVEGTLEPFRVIAQGIAEGHQEASDRAIMAIDRCEAGFLNIGEYDKLTDPESIDFRRLRLGSKSQNAIDCKNTVGQPLWRAAIMQQMCQKVTYCMIDKVRLVLGGKYSPLKEVTR